MTNYDWNSPSSGLGIIVGMLMVMIGMFFVCETRPLKVENRSELYKTEREYKMALQRIHFYGTEAMERKIEEKRDSTKRIVNMHEERIEKQRQKLREGDPYRDAIYIGIDIINEKIERAKERSRKSIAEMKKKAEIEFPKSKRKASELKSKLETLRQENDEHRPGSIRFWYRFSAGVWLMGMFVIWWFAGPGYIGFGACLLYGFIAGMIALWLHDLIM